MQTQLFGGSVAFVLSKSRCQADWDNFADNDHVYRRSARVHAAGNGDFKASKSKPYLAQTVISHFELILASTTHIHDDSPNI